MFHQDEGQNTYLSGSEPGHDTLWEMSGTKNTQADKLITNLNLLIF